MLAKSRKFINLLSIFISILLFFIYITPGYAAVEPIKQPIVMAYWENWGTYDNFPMMNNAQKSSNPVLSAQLKGLNALAYAFLEVNPDGIIKFSDVWSDLNPNSAMDKKFCGLSPESCPDFPNNAGLGNFSAFVNAPIQHHIISIGGENHDADWEAALKHPDQFVASLKMLVDVYHIDWLDIDYEPVNGVPPEDIQRLINLTNKIKQALPNLTISYTTLANPDNIKNFGKTNWRELNKNLTYISIMGYEMHGAFDKDNPYTALQSALTTNDRDDYSDANTLKALNSMGIPNDKIILGMPFYGSAVGGVKSGGLNQLFTESVKGNLDDDKCSSNLNSNNMCDGLIQYKTIVNDHYQAVPVVSKKGMVTGVYAYDAKNKIFVSYDNPESAASKAHFVLDKKMAGMMFWAIRFDKPINNPQSLLRSVDTVFNINPNLG